MTKKPKPIPSKVMAAIELLRLGFTDSDLICRLSGLMKGRDTKRKPDLDRLADILCGIDNRVLRMLVHGTRESMEDYSSISEPIRCPTCKSKINLLPCVLCSMKLGIEKQEHWLDVCAENLAKRQSNAA